MGDASLPQVVDDDVDEPGAERSALFGVLRLLALHVTLRYATASSRAASRASAITPASKLGLWQLGACMSPNSLCAATVQPPAQTGMNAQSWHCSHAESRSKFLSAWLRNASSRPSICPVECCASPANPGQ